MNNEIIYGADGLMVSNVSQVDNVIVQIVGRLVFEEALSKLAVEGGIETWERLSHEDKARSEFGVHYLLTSNSDRDIVVPMALKMSRKSAQRHAKNHSWVKHTTLSFKNRKGRVRDHETLAQFARERIIRFIDNLSD